MGVYLSKPITNVEAESGKNEFLTFASGKMQGWRTKQEHDHSCVLDFTNECSLFGVYDGHVGIAVARLCSKKLPERIKTCQEFLDGNYSEALINSFLELDKDILTPETQELLQQLADNTEIICDTDENDDNDENEDILLQEIITSVSTIIEKFKSDSDKKIHNTENNANNNEAEIDDEDLVEDSIGETDEDTDEDSDGDTNEDSDEWEDDFESEDITENDSGIELEVENENNSEPENEVETDNEDDNETDTENENLDDIESECEDYKTLLHRYLNNSIGFDNASAATVSIIDRKNRKLYVANAGSSKCVLCRDGIAFDLSIDHKSMDKFENERNKLYLEIIKPEEVKNDKIPNRTIGGHNYKMAKNKKIKFHTISALPDIQTIDIKPCEDEFVILASESIWNLFSSQQLVDFVKERKSSKSLSDIINEILFHCLSTEISDKGIGCDNMTCIIMTFNS